MLFAVHALMQTALAVINFQHGVSLIREHAIEAVETPLQGVGSGARGLEDAR